MSLDLSKFKKVEDGKDVAILQHPDGHKIEIVKNVLNKKYSKDLNKLPLHMYQGGETPRGKDQDLPEMMGPMPEQGGAAAPKWPDTKSYFVNGTFDSDRYAVANPDTPSEAKLAAAQRLAAKEDAEKKAKADVEAERLGKQQSEYEAARKYNELAAQRGMPSMAMPEMPAQSPTQGTLVASADNSAGLGANVPSTNIDGGEATIIGRGPQQPSAVDQYGATMATGLQGGLLGLQQEAKALGDLGKQQANIYQQEIDQQQKLNNDINTKMAEYEKNNQALVQAYQSGQVDPNRFMNSMSTAQRVTTAIGLILGGIGGGTGENPAMKYINTQIDNDIEAQKTELGKRQNLLSYNLQHFGNMKDAIAMTKSQMAAMTDAKIKQAAAAASDPIAKARAMQASSELISKQNDILKGIATNQTLQQAAQSGAAKGNPVDIIKLKVPEAQQGKYYEELQKAQNAQNALQLAKNAYAKMKTINKAAALIPGTQANTEWTANREKILINLSETLGEKWERVRKSVEEFLPERIMEDNEEIDAKLASMEDLLQKNMSFPLLDSIGINTFSRKQIQERTPQVK